MKFGHGFPPFLLACVIGFSINASANAEPSAPSSIARPVKIQQVSFANGGRERILPGEVMASDRAVLSFRVAGEIANIKVRPGDAVKTGELLATLDPALYEQQRDVEKAKFELAKVLYERASSLVKRGVISQNDHDQARSDFTVAQAALDKANSDLADTHLYAPYDGIISKRYMRVYEFTTVQLPILGIQTQYSIDVRFQLPEQFIGSMQQKENKNSAHSLEVKFDSRDEWFVATLKELNTIADDATGSYSIILTLPVPEHLNLLPGMAANVKIQLSESAKPAPFVVPPSAIVREQQQDYVFVWLAEPKQVKKVPVSLQHGQVVSGLNDGDWLVVAGASELSDGQSAVRWVKERGL